MIQTLEVHKREETGSRQVAKLRSAGFVPAVLYGHGEENVNLRLKKDAVTRLIKNGSKLISLTGEVKDTALLRDVQWDSMGSNIIHLDFARVSKNETVEVTLPVELHGEPAGATGTSQLRFVTHEVSVRCPAGLIPEHIVVDISGLRVGQPIHVSDLILPEGATSVTPDSMVIAQLLDSSPAAQAETADAN